VFTLLRDREEHDRDPLLDLLAAVYRYAEQGRTVDCGGFTQFAPGGWGPFAAVVYTRSESSVASAVAEELLRGILLTEAEIELAKEYGFSRVLSRLGRAYRHYPFPTWIDSARPSVASADELEKTVLHEIPWAWPNGASALLIRDQDLILLRLTSAAGGRLAHALAQLPRSAAIAVLTDIDPIANGCLVWEPGQLEPAAIAPNGGDNGSALSACFLLFAPDQPANGGCAIEDGLALELTASSWTALRAAIETRHPVAIQAENDGLSFSLEWVS
jgi:hypothetical protein